MRHIGHLSIDRSFVYFGHHFRPSFDYAVIALLECRQLTYTPIHNHAEAFGWKEEGFFFKYRHHAVCGYDSVACLRLLRPMLTV